MDVIDSSLGLGTYDGTALADYEDVIVVTTNYRTNGKYCHHLEFVLPNNPCQCLDSQHLLNFQ